MNIKYRPLTFGELDRALFSHFTRHQQVTLCWRKIEGNWVVRPDPFVDDWSEEDFHFLVSCLKNTLQTEGAVFGAFANGQLKGFASVEGGRFGKHLEYLDLTSLHVSKELRGCGMGKKLFTLAADWAWTKGAQKLYISAHSAVETQAFYRAMGCIEATEYHQGHVAQEPFDCQLECDLHTFFSPSRLLD